jgi:hypothetical protein
MGVAKVVALFVLAAGISGNQGPTPRLDAPDLGQPFPCVPTGLMMIKSAQFSPTCKVVYNRIPFDVAGDFGWDQTVPLGARVVYVAVDDPRFQTREGIHVGSSLADVLKTGAMTPKPEPGWAFHTRLDSGWNAAFVVGPELTGEPLPADSRVAWMFKRK